jgi:hypothetical protein
MGSDAGRDFLSTKDPVRKELPADESIAANKEQTVKRPFSLAGILEQYFMRRDKQ